MATTITYKGSDLTSFSNTSKTLRTAGKYLEGDITVSASTVLGTTTVVPSETTQTISPASGQEGLSSVTVNGITSTYVGSSVPRRDMDDVSITYDSTTNEIKTSVSRGYYDGGGTTIQSPQALLPYQSATTIIPSETAQTAVDIHKWTNGTITVAAITPTYVGSSVPAGSLTVSGPTVTASAGYYANAATKTIPNATLNSPITVSLSAADRISVDANGLVNAVRNNFSQTKRPVTVSGYVSATDSNAFISIQVPTSTSTYQLPTQAATTITPSNATQTVTGQKYMTGDITVQPIPSQYIVPSGTLTITSVDTTTTFDATSYASVAVNLKNADVTAY